MTDQKAGMADRPAAAVDPGAGTSAEKSFENEGGGSQAPGQPASTSPTGKVEHGVEGAAGPIRQARQTPLMAADGPSSEIRRQLLDQIEGTHDD